MNPESKLNEFIPSGPIVTNVSGFSTKNLCILNKIIPDKEWTFEPNETQPEAAISYEYDIEFLEYKSVNTNYYGYNQQNVRLNFSGINQDLRYGQVKAGK